MTIRKQTFALSMLVTLALGLWLGAHADVLAQVTTAKTPAPKLDFSGPKTLNPQAWPYPDRFDSVKAAPGQHWLRYEDDHIRFIEVTYRPGEKGDAPHGHPYSSVFVRDSGGAKATDTDFDPDHPEFRMKQAQGPAPEGQTFPTCSTATPQPPHQPENIGTIPFHFYRVEFKRIDGDQFEANWRKWYPYMLTNHLTLQQWQASQGGRK